VKTNFWRSEKVQLCAVEEADLEVLLSLEEDTELDRYEDFIRFPSNREQRRAFFKEMAKRDGKDGAFFWLVKDLEGRYVGSIGTFDCDSRVGVFKYGLRILRPYWRRGYARDAIHTVLRHYFYELRYQKATAIVYLFNERSRRLHESLGFVLEGAYGAWSTRTACCTTSCISVWPEKSLTNFNPSVSCRNSRATLYKPRVFHDEKNGSRSKRLPESSSPLP
jgi:RimJ/RimL family protein N-acetyltransferase